MLDLLEVAKPVRSEVEQLEAGWQSLAEEGGRDPGDEHLATVADGQEPGHAVERGPEEVAVAGLGGPRVECHPGADGSDGAGAPTEVAGLPDPRELRQTTLRLLRRPQARDGLVEMGQEPVAGRLHDGAAVPLDGRPEDRVVGSEEVGHRVRVLVPEARAALDVGHQERRDRGARGRARRRVRDAGRLGHGADDRTLVAARQRAGPSARDAPAR